VRGQQHAHLLFVLCGERENKRWGGWGGVRRGGARRGGGARPAARRSCGASRWRAKKPSRRRAAAARTDAFRCSSLPALLTTAPTRITSLPTCLSSPPAFTRGWESRMMVLMVLLCSKKKGRWRSRYGIAGALCSHFVSPIVGS
jgi:hypothetical protein